MEEVENESIETADILTFDELLEDDYYRSEFEKRLNQELSIKSHSDVKGGTNMDNVQQQEGEIKEQVQEQAQPQSNEADNPATSTTQAKENKGEQAATDTPASEMSKEQFATYNETLRRVSKAAKGEMKARYNAFEDVEVKTAVKKAILAGETLDAKQLAAEVAARHTPKTDPTATDVKISTQPEQNEVTALKAELALVKAGIRPERLEAAKKLFLAEGGDPAKAEDFVKLYPEWVAAEGGGIVFSKAPPLSSKTAAAGGNPPIMNDFERKVLEARKARGLPT